MSETRERGLEFFSDVLGKDAGDIMRHAIEQDGFSSTLGQIAVDFAFGSVWTRPGLERKHRSLVVISILIATRQTAELKNHFRIGLANGLTRTELEEAVIQSIPYLGLPACTQASSALIEVLREKGIDTQSKTSEERGLV